MRALILASSEHPGMEALNEHYPTPLLPLVDRPFIQHLVEVLVEQGVTHFDMILTHLPEHIEAALGNGTRWGCTIAYALARSTSHAYRTLATLAVQDTEPLLLVHADVLPQLAAGQLQSTSPSPTLFMYDDAGVERWTGWAVLSGVHLRALPSHATPENCGFALKTLAREYGQCVSVPQVLRFTSYAHLLAAQERALGGAFPGLMLTGTTPDDGIRLCRNVSLHPTATVTPPVFIGENCRIGAHAKIGPGAVIAGNCILEDHCSVQHSFIFQGSYVGEALDLQQAIVDKNRLINVAIGTSITVTDTFILGSMTERHVGRMLAAGMMRLAAVLCLVLLAPVLALTAAWLRLTRRGPVVHAQTIARLPAPDSDAELPVTSLLTFAPAHTAQPGQRVAYCRHFFLVFLPGMLSVAQGHLRMVGVAPRTPDEVRALPADWRRLYLGSKAGLVTEALIAYPHLPNEDEQYSADAFYAVQSSWRHDLGLLCKYLARVVCGG
ncbi:MAG: NDP-sugar synthase, partial [bacterium]|nr:NDP-sugar synthase [bacterium]